MDEKVGRIPPPAGDNKIRPMKLERMARSIARTYGDKGALILTVGEHGIRVGVHGLNAREIQDALCVGIHYNFVMDTDAGPIKD